MGIGAIDGMGVSMRDEDVILQHHLNKGWKIPQPRSLNTTVKDLLKAQPLEHSQTVPWMVKMFVDTAPGVGSLK